MWAAPTRDGGSISINLPSRRTSQSAGTSARRPWPMSRSMRRTLTRFHQIRELQRRVEVPDRELAVERPARQLEARPRKRVAAGRHQQRALRHDELVDPILRCELLRNRARVAAPQDERHVDTLLTVAE